MIGFDYNSLNEINLDWIEAGLRETLEQLEDIEVDEHIQKAIDEVKDTQRKIEDIRKQLGR
jgi:prolyl oligopeptidase PreP (S9A serine peptidase family)